MSRRSRTILTVKRDDTIGELLKRLSVVFGWSGFATSMGSARWVAQAELFQSMLLRVVEFGLGFKVRLSQDL